MISNTILKYCEGKEKLIVNNIFKKNGVQVYFRLNEIYYNLLVSDEILVNNIGIEMYETFRFNSKKNKEQIEPKDFIYKNNDKNIKLIDNLKISSYILKFRELKIWNAYLCFLISINDWNTNKFIFKNDISVRDYMLNISNFFVDTFENPIKKFAYNVYEKIYFNRNFFLDIPFNLFFGMSIAIKPEMKLIKNYPLMFFILFMIIIIVLIILYYYKFRD